MRNGYRRIQCPRSCLPSPEKNAIRLQPMENDRSISPLRRDNVIPSSDRWSKKIVQRRFLERARVFERIIHPATNRPDSSCRNCFKFCRQKLKSTQENTICGGSRSIRLSKAWFIAYTQVVCHKSPRIGFGTSRKCAGIQSTSKKDTRLPRSRTASPRSTPFLLVPYPVGQTKSIVFGFMRRQIRSASLGVDMVASIYGD